jgi:prevent-host-death family protein
MAKVTIHEAKANFSELIRRVEAGEVIVIARGDTPVAVLKEYNSADIAARRAAGRGSLVEKVLPIPDSVFFGPMSDDELAAWTDPKIFP